MDYICPSCSAQIGQFDLDLAHRSFEGGLSTIAIHAQCPACGEDIAVAHATLHFVSGVLTIVKWENER